MERTEVLDMMSSLKLYGMRSAYDETLATALKRKHAALRRRSPESRDLREAGALDQVPAHRRQAAAGQGDRGPSSPTGFALIRGDERGRHRRSPGARSSAQQSRREFASAVSTTRTGHAAISKHQVAAKVQLSSC